MLPFGKQLHPSRTTVHAGKPFFLSSTVPTLFPPLASSSLEVLNNPFIKLASLKLPEGFLFPAEILTGTITKVEKLVQRHTANKRQMRLVLSLESTISSTLPYGFLRAEATSSKTYEGKASGRNELSKWLKYKRGWWRLRQTREHTPHLQVTTCKSEH